MRRMIRHIAMGVGMVAAGLFWNGGIGTGSGGGIVSVANARVGNPATPLSYAGVARRSTVGAPVAGGVGGPASGVGVLPGAGAGQAGVGYSAGPGVNLGGPVNRVGVR